MVKKALAWASSLALADILIYQVDLLTVLLTVYLWNVPKSPDHSDINISRNWLLTHQRRVVLSVGGNVWYTTVSCTQLYRDGSGHCSREVSLQWRKIHP